MNRHEDSLSVAANEVLLACGPRVYTLTDSLGNTNILVYIDDDGVSPDFKLQAVNNDPAVIGLNEYTLTVGLLDYPGVPTITEQIKIDIFCDPQPYQIDVITPMPVTNLVYDIASRESITY